MRSMLPSIVILGTVAIAALVPAFRSDPAAGDLAARRRAAMALAFATGMQALHFLEEAATGFNERFPGLLDLPAMPFSAFVAFNLFWIAFWIVSVAGLRAGKRTAFFAAWFLAIAGALNGIAHPAMAIVAGGYFPGVVTSPLAAIACIWLWSRLLALGRRRSPSLL